MYDVSTQNKRKLKPLLIHLSNMCNYLYIQQIVLNIYYIWKCCLVQGSKYDIHFSKEDKQVITMTGGKF